MFTNQTEYQVKESLRKSKFLEEMNNMKRASEELDYYNNEQMPYVLAEIGRLRKDKASQKYATYYPLTNQIIDEISVMFSTGVDYELNYDNEDEKDLYNANLSTIVKESGLISVLSDVNIYTNLNGDCGVLLDFDEETKIPKLRLITRDLFFVEQDDDDPTKISAVYVYLSPFENSPTRLSYSGYYTKITKEEIVEVRVNFNSGKAEEIESSRQENTLGFIPFTIFNKQTPINSIFSSIKNPLPELNLQINLEISRLNWVEEFQAFATLVLINADGVSNNYGADKVLILNDVDGVGKQVDAKFISPGISFTELDNVIVNHMQRAGQLMGIGSSAYKESSTFNSGYQLRLSKEDVVRLNEKQKHIYERKTKELLEKLIKINNLLSDSKIGDNYNSLEVNILKPVFDISTQEKEESYSRRIALNLTSPIEILSTENDISNDDARELYLKILEDNKMGKDSSESILNSIGMFE